MKKIIFAISLMLTLNACCGGNNKCQKEVYYKKRAELELMYPDSDSSFIDSMIWGYITDSTVMGGVMGGDMLGAMVGDMLNDSDQVEMGGGDFGGAGSDGAWQIDDDSTNVDNSNYSVSENFS